MNAACSSATSTGPAPRPAASAAMRVDGESARSRNAGLWHSVRWSKPVMNAGRSTQLAGPVAGGEHHGGGAVGDRRQVVAAQRLAHVVAGEQRVDVAVALHLRVRVAHRVAAGPDRDLGHRPLVGDAGGDQRRGPGARRT